MWRGGYRLSYDPPFYNIYLNIASSSPQVLAQTLTGAVAAANPLPAEPIGSNVRTALASSLVFGVSDPRSFNQTTISPNFGPDKIHSWSFGVQRELNKSAGLEVRYVGNHATNLFQSTNANPFIAGLAAGFPSLVPSGLTPCPAADAINAKAVGRVNCNEGVLRERTTGIFRLRRCPSRVAYESSFRSVDYDYLLHLQQNHRQRFGDIQHVRRRELKRFFTKHVELHFCGARAFRSRHSSQLDDRLRQEIPVFRGATRRRRAHASVDGRSRGLTTLLPVSPTRRRQYFTNAFSGGVANDTPFDNAFIGTFETSRPFWGNPSAPARAAEYLPGMPAAVYGSGCTLPSSTLIDFGAFDATGAVNTTSKLPFVISSMAGLQTRFSARRSETWPATPRATLGPTLGTSRCSRTSSSANAPTCSGT